MKIVTDKCIDLIETILKKYEVEGSPRYYCNNYDYKTEKIRNIDDLLLPDIILWDPMSQLQMEFHCPHCFEDKSIKSPLTCSSEWTRAQTNSMYPRSIWDMNWFFIIVGKIYTCSNHHRIISYHAGILQQAPEFEVPFVLTHDSGMTRKLHDFTVRLVESGISFNSIQLVIKENILDEYMRQKIRFSRNFPLIQDSFKTLSPSVSTLINVFVVFIQRLRSLYERHFRSINFTSLSLDHTFKVASNIGYKNGKTWVKQYDSILVILNEIGLVKKFQFTKGTSLENTKSLLDELAIENPSPEFICVDNCCHGTFSYQCFQQQR